MGAFFVILVVFIVICLFNDGADAIIPGVIGIIVLAVLIFLLNNPDVFLILLGLGICLGIIALIAHSIERQKRFEAGQKRKVQQEQERITREKTKKATQKIRDDHISDLQIYGEKHGFLTHGDDEHVCGQALLDGVMNKYSAQIKNDYYRITSPDQYGRVTEKQLEDWRWHLLEVADTCKLDIKFEKRRRLLRQIISWRTDAKFIAGKEQFDETNLEIGTLREFLKNSGKVDGNSMTAFRFYKDIMFAAFTIYLEQQDDSPLDRFDDSMSGIDFEYFCSEILDDAGWSTNVLPGSGDHGADIIAELDGLMVAVQCKKYSKPLGNTPVQEITAARIHYSADKACVVTNSTYTKGAQTLAKSNDVVLLHYTDLPKLIDYAQ